MSTSTELMYAILAMDSYNRGYNPGLVYEGNVVGTATVTQQSETSAESPEVAAGFYAVAYEWNGESAGCRPGGRATFISAKVAKTSDAPSDLIGWAGRELRKSGPTRGAQTRPAGRSERPSLGPGGRRRKVKGRGIRNVGDSNNALRRLDDLASPQGRIPWVNRSGVVENRRWCGASPANQGE